MRITNRNTSSATSNTDVATTEDLPCTVGAPTAPKDLLPADYFPGWELSRRSQMLFNGLGCVATLEHFKIVRASGAVTGDNTNGSAPKVVLGKLTEGKFQIPTTIMTSRVSNMTNREAVYVHCMFRCFSGTVNDPVLLLVLLIIHLPSMNRGSH